MSSHSPADSTVPSSCTVGLQCSSNHMECGSNISSLYADWNWQDVVFLPSLWMCVFTLSISLGALLLLPLSIVTEEIFSSYPDNDYISWLNPMLIQSTDWMNMTNEHSSVVVCISYAIHAGLWNQVFVCSNLCLFVLMPFAYLLIEAEGFSGWRKVSAAAATSSYSVVIWFCVLIQVTCFREFCHVFVRHLLYWFFLEFVLLFSPSWE